MNTEMKRYVEKADELDRETAKLVNKAIKDLKFELELLERDNDLLDEIKEERIDNCVDAIKKAEEAEQAMLELYRALDSVYNY